MVTKTTEVNEVEVRRLADSAIDRLLSLRLTHDLLLHRIDEGLSKWRDLQQQLHAEQYPIKGAGVIATLENLGATVIANEDGGFLHDEEDVAPEDIVDNLGTYPLAAASSAYAFSVMEEFGNEVARLVHPNQKTYTTWSWHKSVELSLDNFTKATMAKALCAFAAPFGADPVRVQSASALRLVAVRTARNDYVHRRDTDIDFHTFCAFCLAVVCQIFFLAVPSATELKRFPWYHFDEEKWRI